MFGLRWRDIVFSFNSYLAMLLAMFVAFSLDLPRPYWAMLTVYITIQPLSGALRSKAVYRVLGTILGGVAAVVLVPNLVDSPIALSIALAAWVGLCLYISLLDRTPRSYVFLLAGYTAAIIGFPSVNAPDAIFDTAVARVEEITLGIVCAVLLHSLVLPRSVSSALAARAVKALADIEVWSDKALNGIADPTTERERRRLANDVTDLHILATHLPFDTSGSRPTAAAVGALQDSLAFALPLATGVEDRLIALHNDATPTPPKLALAIRRVKTWIRAGQSGSTEVADQLEAECLAAEPALDTQSDWSALLTASAAERGRELVETLQDCRDLSRYIGTPSQGITPRVGPLVRHRAQRPFYRDHGLAMLSSAAAIVAMLVCSTAWIALAWPEGATAVMMAAVFSSFFATQDDPSPALLAFLLSTAISLPIAALYLFAILPAIDGFPLLAVVLAPFFLFAGYLQADARLAPRAIPLIIGVAGALSLQENFSADFPGFFNGNLALILGIAATLIITVLFRSVGAEWSARRILRAGWLELARAAIPGNDPDRIAWTSFMVDRLGLLTPRLLAVKNPEFARADALNDLRIGLNIIDLQRALRLAEGDAHMAITHLLRNLSAYFRSLRVGNLHRASTTILRQLDVALASLAGALHTPERYRGLIALTGLRRNLFPNATPYRPPSSASAGFPA